MRSAHPRQADVQVGARGVLRLFEGCPHALMAGFSSAMRPLRMPADRTHSMAAVAQGVLIEIGGQDARPRAAVSRATIRSSCFWLIATYPPCAMTAAVWVLEAESCGVFEAGLPELFSSRPASGLQIFVPVCLSGHPISR